MCVRECKKELNAKFSQMNDLQISLLNPVTFSVV